MTLTGTVTVLPMVNFVAIVIVSIVLITWSMKRRGARLSRYVDVVYMQTTANLEYSVLQVNNGTCI